MPTIPAVQAPAVPGGYSVPAGAISVMSTTALLSALASTTPSDIVLADGIYDNASPFLNPNGHRVYAATLGGAVLRAGFSLGGNWGPGGAVLRGLTFDVSDSSRTVAGGVITVWGNGQRSQILDVTIRGNRAVPAGIFAKVPEGLVVQRVVASGFTDYGVYVDPHPLFDYSPSTAPVLEDLTLSDVSRAAPRSSNGTAEACLWVGTRASVRRVRLRDCAWMGLWTGTSLRDAVHEDLDIDRTPIGIYAEHYTRNSTFRNFTVGPNVEIGVNCEWADPAWSSLPGCDGAVFESGLFETTKVGVYLDAGTARTTVRNSVFVGQSWAGIGDHLGVSNAYSGNDFSRIDAGASTTTTAHINTSG